MRAGALRRILLVLLPALCIALTGCSSAMKKHYLRHLEVTIAPAATGDLSVAVPGRRAQPGLASAENNQPQH